MGHYHLRPDAREAALLSRLNDVRDLGVRGMAEKRGPRLLAPGADAGKVRRVVDTMAAVNAVGYGQAARMLSTGNIRGDVESLQPDMPVQIVYGDCDVITPPEENEMVAKLMPEVKIDRIADAGHAVYLEKPEEFNKAVRDFISFSIGKNSQ